MLDPYGALICTMVIVSAADSNMTDAELAIIGEIVGHLPVFREFDRDSLPNVLESCSQLLSREEGLDEAFAEIREALPANLRETAYALAVEVAASDLAVGKEELRFLAMLRDHLGLDKLVTAALERGAIARYQTE